MRGIESIKFISSALKNKQHSQNSNSENRRGWGSNINVSHQWALVARRGNSFLDCIGHWAASRLRRGSCTSVQHCWATCGACGPVLGSLMHETHGHSGTSPGKAPLRGLEHLSYRKDWELGLFSLEKRRLRGTSLFCTSIWKEDVVRLCPVVHSDVRRDNGLKLKCKKFCLNMRKRGKFLLWGCSNSGKVTQRGCGVSISVNVLDPFKALRNLFQVALH